MPPKKTVLESTLKRLADTKVKLTQCENGENVRGREKKIDLFKKTIADLELKVSQLQNPMNRMITGSESTLQSMQNFTPIELKQEQLEVSVPPGGPGSAQNPMQLDFDAHETSHPLSRGVGEVTPPGVFISAAGSQAIEHVPCPSSTVLDIGPSEDVPMQCADSYAVENGYPSFNSPRAEESARSEDQSKPLQEVPGVDSHDDGDNMNIDTVYFHRRDDHRDTTQGSNISLASQANSIDEGEHHGSSGNGSVMIGHDIGYQENLVMNVDNGPPENGDWVWDGNCNVEIDSTIYTFKIEGYTPDDIIETTPDTEIGQSPKTNVLLQHFEHQGRVIAHAEHQLSQLKSKQQSLFKAITKGFKGNLKIAFAHVVAITRSCQDIKTLENHIEELSMLAKAQQWDLLSSRNEDDHGKLIETQNELRNIQDQLSIIDPMDTMAIQAAQALIRLSKAKIGLLQKGVDARADEMKKIAAVAKGQSAGRMTSGGSKPSEAAADQKTIGKGKQKAQTKKTKPTNSQSKFGSPIPFPDVEGVNPLEGAPMIQIQAEVDSESDAALESLGNYLKKQDPELFRYKHRRWAREKMGYLPDASFTSMDTSRLVFSTNIQSLCEYHRKGSNDTTFRPDTVIELTGSGFKGQSVSTAKEAVAIDGHLHCGCSLREVIMEFFLWKTTRAFSSNPKLAGRAFAMEELSRLKPCTRAFWNKSIRDYTGLQVEDFLSRDYGTDAYAMRIALTQLHTQVKRLKGLRAPVVVQVIFPDQDLTHLPDVIHQYSDESGWLLKKLEQHWGDLEAKRQVFPLPMIKPARKTED